MYKRILAVAAASCLPVLGMASVQTNQFSASCSNALTMSGGAGMQWLCAGDLTLSGFEGMGSINADAGIELRATGKLTLDNITLTAPSIMMAASDLQIQATTMLRSPSIHLTSYGSLVFNGQANLLPPDPLAAIELAASRDPGVLQLLRNLTDLSGAATLQVSGSGNVTLSSQGVNPLIPAVPEPASWGLVVVGLLAMTAYSRRQA